jgi:hypothetical protein
MSAFAKDLSEGKAAEKRMRQKLLDLEHYVSVVLEEGPKLEYDAIALTGSGEYEYLEFKSDKKSALTGNFFVEYWCRDHESGISTTLANFYLVETYNPAAIWKIPVPKLRELVQRCKSVSGGDDGAAQGYLLKVSNIPKEYKL